MTELAAIPAILLPDQTADFRTLSLSLPTGEGMVAETFAALLGAQIGTPGPAAGGRLPESGKTLPVGPAAAPDRPPVPPLPAPGAASVAALPDLAAATRQAPDGEPEDEAASPPPPTEPTVTADISPLVPGALPPLPLVQPVHRAPDATVAPQPSAQTSPEALRALPIALHFAAPGKAPVIRSEAPVSGQQLAVLPAPPAAAMEVRLVPPTAAPLVAAPVLRVKMGEAAALPASPPFAVTPPLRSEPIPADAPVLATLTEQPLLSTGAAEPRGAGAAPTAAPAPLSPARPHDFATLVDTLVAAREAAVPAAVRIAVDHAEFGAVSIRFEPRDGALDIAMASSDPGFARAVSVAMPVQPGAASADTAGQSPAQRGSADTSSQDAGQPRGGSADQRHEPRDARQLRARNENRPGPPSDNDPRGIFA